jgi:tetratricopeptide (TPR) repeat protein
MNRPPDPPGGSVFVGRTRELSALCLALDEATSGHGRLVLLAGEPGIGKSALTERLSSLARGRDAEVLVGRCHEQKGAAYWPWIQAIRPRIRRRSKDLSRAQRETPFVARMVGDLCNRPADPASAATHGPAHARLQLFDAMTTFLADAAADRPIVVILEDLHWADAPSLLLLQFIAREMATSRLLVVGTYRDMELQPPHPLLDILGDLTRHEHSRHVNLDGLSPGDVARFMELSVGNLPSTVAEHVHRQTGGNPLFVVEVVRLLAGEGLLRETGTLWTHHPIPHGVRETIERRLKQLSPACRRALESAATLGESFALIVLERVTELPRGRLLQLLDEAAAARLAMTTPGVLGRYQLSHALVREVLYRGLPTSERLALHRKAATALTEHYADNLGPHLSEVAHHFYHAAPGGEAASAIHYAILAAERSLDRLGYEEAAGHYERALQALDLAPTPDEQRRCDLLLALADAQAKAGDLTGARQSCLLATEVARALGDPTRSARAAIGTGQVWIELGTVEAALVGPLEEALAALGGGDSDLRSRLLARLAVAINPMEFHERAVHLSRQALDMARRIGDFGTLAYAASARQLTGGPDDLADRLAVADEIVSSTTGVDGEMVLEARFWHVYALLELGDRTAMDREVEAIERGAERLGHPCPRYLAAVLQTVRALLDGRLADAERLAVKALSLGERWAPSVAAQVLSSHLFALRKEQGRLGELIGPLADLARQYPSVSGFRCGLAYVHAELGQSENAQNEFERSAANGFTDLPRDLQWLPVLATLAEVCVFLNDRESAQTLYGLLLPYAERNVVAGPGGFVYGSASLFLGMLARVLSRRREGQRHLEDALALHRRMGAPVHVARTQLEMARHLVAGESACDWRRARELLGAARETVERLDLERLRRKIAEVEESTPGAVTAANRSIPQVSGVAAAPAPGRLQAGVFKREGDYWTIGYEDSVFRVKDSVGLRYLAELLGHPCEEILASDLIASVNAHDSPFPRVPSRTMGGPSVVLGCGDAGVVLDRQAREAYRRRLRDLRAERSEAQAANDLARAQRADSEIMFVEEELKRAFGLGGRARRAASDIERARVSVTRAIRSAVRKIARHDTALGRHLTTAIKTGTFCSYRRDLGPLTSWTF